MRLNQKLSEKQLLIINFIENYYNENGISPTIEDVRVGCKLSSKSVVSYNLNILEEIGYLDRKKGMARSITSTKEIEKNNLLIKAKVSCLDGSVSIYSEETSDYTNLDDQISKLSQYFIENNAKEIIRR